MPTYPTTRACAQCDNPFTVTARRSRVKFCSPACRHAAHTQTRAMFWHKTVEHGDCLDFTGTILDNGYGVYCTGGKPNLAHRLAYELAHGPIPDGLYVCHRCDRRCCVRPEHLFLGTAADNQRDMAAKGRSLQGERHHKAKVTDAAVREIRRRVAAGETCRALAPEYGVSPSAIERIASRRAWAHVP